ncbi:pyruvate dehydrogenase (acetyl-transferring) E1 component subunit alpha [Streptomyces sp. NPDC048623]|uniref:pyruvate dehydrogenase (acetyl-transferring) E1 component subunit alpha n=1 Tax=Streptomyces sp. NPDC048623 TaxID=3155761 RepID=UPI003426D239
MGTAHGGTSARTSDTKRPRRARTRAASAPASAPAPSPAPESAHELDLLRQMLLIRRFEERCVELYSSAAIRGFVHLYIGEEAVAVGVHQALSEQDAVVSTYREHGHALARGVPAEAVMAEMYGKTTGCSHGRGGSMHLFDSARRFYGGNAIVGGGLPLAAGLALADRMRGESRVTCCFFGDGAFAEGEFHETANLAALWGLPVLFVCENNLYAMGTALAREHAQTDLAMRAASYGMAAWAVDGMDVHAVEKAACGAVESIRAGNGPHFLEARTYRFRAHSMYDPDRYRPKEEIEEWKRRDPITGFTTGLKNAGLADAAALDALEREVTEVIDRAVRAAEQAPEEPAETLLLHVTGESEEAPS